MSGHPSDAELARLSSGDLDEPTRAHLEDHLASCAACRVRARRVPRMPDMYNERTERFSTLGGSSESTPERSPVERPQALDPNASFDLANLPTKQAVEVPLASFKAGPAPGGDPTLEGRNRAGVDSTVALPGDAPRPEPTRNEVARALSPGERVDQFEVVELVGRGGLGEVYLAKDSKLARRVALKIVRAERLGSRAVVQRFLFEARATAQFNHPNIVTIYDVGEYKGSPYFALEFLDGRSLGQRMRKERIPEVEAIEIAHQIASALKQAHKSGVVHRDLKPDNVFLPDDGPVRVLDFGMGKLVQQRDDPDAIESGIFSNIEPTQAGLVVGTPSYMAPEQWVGAEVMPATDVYALGLILFAMLTGQRAYGDLRGTEDYRNAALSPAPLPGMPLLEDVRPSLRDLVERCLQKRPERRPSAAEVITTLRAVMSEDFDIAIVSDPRMRPLPRPSDAVAPVNRGSEVAPLTSGEEPPSELTYSSFVGRPSLVDPAEPTDEGRAPSASGAVDAGDQTEHTLTLVTDAPALDAPLAIESQTGAAEHPPAPGPSRQRLFAAAGVALVVVVAVAAVVLGRGSAGGASAGDEVQVKRLAAVAAPSSGDATPDDARADDTDAQDTTAEDAKAEGTRADDTDAQDTTAEDAKAEGAKAEGTKAEGTKGIQRAVAKQPSSSQRAAARQQSRRSIECRAPASVTWRTTSGAEVGRGNGPCRVPADTTTLLARDRSTGGTSRVPIEAGRADLGALPKGKAWFQAKPYAEVTLGSTKIGVTPFKPVELVVGSYTATMVFEGKVKKERFEVRAGETTRVRVDMR